MLVGGISYYVKDLLKLAGSAKGQELLWVPLYGEYEPENLDIDEEDAVGCLLA